MKAPVRVFIDGGARGNPGPAGFGVRVEDAEGETLVELYGYIGEATNNVAEYAALIAALEWLSENAADLPVQLYSDSQLLVRQFHGQYRVKNAGLRPLYQRARTLAYKVKGLEVSHVRREQNREADALANRAMDERDGNADPVLPV